MSRGGQPYEVVLRITLEEADQQLEGFLRRWQDRFTIRPQVEDSGAPGSVGTSGSSTFGGQQVQGNPSAWRSADPVRSYAARGSIPEPVLAGTPFSQLPAHVQSAIAAQDPQTRAWMAQQANPPMSPADVRQAERFHQWNIRNQGYQQRQDVLAENRQSRDETWYDRDQQKAERQQLATRLRGEREQERNEGWYDRDQLRASNQQRREQIRSQERQHQNESWYDRDQQRASDQASRSRLGAENRQERDESYYARQQNQEAKVSQRQRLADENRQHRDESFTDRRDFGDYQRSERDRLRGENRQERDETWYDRDQRRADQQSRRQRVRSENQQERDETWYDRDQQRADRQSRQRQIRDENRQHRDESWLDRRDASERTAAQRRQERDESSYERSEGAYGRRVFRSDQAGRSPTQQLRAVRDRMGQVDPESNEYQELREQESQLGRRTGLNRVIAPNHLYMQAMFAAFDVASTVTHMARSAAQANAADTVQGRLEAQVGAVTGGGGIFSSILQGAWDIAGMWVPGLDSPGLVERDVMTQGARSQLQDQFRSTVQATEASRIARGGPAGTFKARYAASEARNKVANDQIDAKVGEIQNLINMSDDEGLNDSRRQMVKALKGQRKENDAVLSREEHDTYFDQQQSLQDVLDRRAAANDIKNGGDEITINRAALVRQQARERKKEAREGDQGALDSLDKTHARELEAYDYTTSRAEAGIIERLKGRSESNELLLIGDAEGAIRVRNKHELDAAINGSPYPLSIERQTEIRKDFRTMESLQIKDVQDRRYLQKEQYTDALNVAEYQASGMQFSAAAQSIMQKGNIEAAVAAFANRPDLMLTAQQTSLANLQTMKRELRLRQYTEGSAQEVSAGTMGPGGTSTVPRELEPETITEGLSAVETAIGRVEKAIEGLVQD